MRNKYIFFLFLQFLYNSLLFSQISTSDGYIITSNNDTLNGKLEYFTTGNSNRCNFIELNSKRIRYFRPDQIKQYCIGQKLFYHSIDYNGDKTFFKVISSGKSFLYLHKDNLFITNGLGQVAKLIGGEKIIELNGRRYLQNNESYKIQLKQQISDTSFYSEIDNLDFDNHEIITLVRKYNEESPDYNHYFKASNTNVFDFFVGSSVSKQIVGNDPIAFEPFFGEHKMNKSTLTVINSFIGISFKRKLLTEKTYLKISLIYERAEKQKYFYSWDLSSTDLVILTGLSEYDQGDSHYRLQNETDINLTSINVPITFNYNFLYGRIRPFIDIGLKGKICLNKKIISTQEIFKDEESYKYKRVVSDLGPSIIGLNLGLGSNYLINTNNSIGIGLVGNLYITSNTYFDKIFDIGFYLSYNF
jgi:hypothetical protein